MNLRLLLLLALVATLPISAQDMPPGETLDKLAWAKKPLREYPMLDCRNDGTRLTITYSGTKPMQCTLRSLRAPFIAKLTSKRYALIGQVHYARATPGNYLEMQSWFPELPGTQETAFHTQTLEMAEPPPGTKTAGKNQEFGLFFDCTGQKTHISHLDLILHLTGPQTVTLSNVKLIQFPDPPAPAPAKKK